jgi:hypothetical protein
MIRIHLFRGSGSGEVYWDEVRLYPEKSIIDYIGRHLLNPEVLLGTGVLV